MQTDNYGKLGYIGNPRRTRLDHVQADEVSFFIEPMDTNHYEAAFFFEGEWVTDVLGEFELYAEPEAGETRVYRYIPKAVLADFLYHHAVSKIR